MLADLCGRVGVEPGRFLAGIATPEVKAQLKANTDEVIARGGFGSPTIFVGDDMFFGNDRLPLVREAVLREIRTLLFHALEKEHVSYFLRWRNRNADSRPIPSRRASTHRRRRRRRATRPRQRDDDCVDEERDPQRVGMTQEGVDAIWRSVENIYATGMHPGISLVVRRHGQIVLKRAVGHAKGNGPGDVDEKLVPMTPDTPVCIFSASKAMAAMTVHLLSEQKQLSLLDPVSHYIPEFAQNGKRDITIYQLLCHKAGIPTIPTNGVDVSELLLDHKEIQRLIYRTAPTSQASTTPTTRSRRAS